MERIVSCRNVHTGRDRDQNPLFPIMSVPYPVLVPVPCNVNISLPGRGVPPPRLPSLHHPHSVDWSRLETPDDSTYFIRYHQKYFWTAILQVIFPSFREPCFWSDFISSTQSSMFCDVDLLIVTRPSADLRTGLRFGNWDPVVRDKTRPCAISVQVLLNVHESQENLGPQI